MSNGANDVEDARCDDVGATDGAATPAASGPRGDRSFGRWLGLINNGEQ